MLTLVIGGAASGKSEFAESLVLESPCKERVYLATLEVWDGESRARVERHRALRAGKGFATVERPVNLASAAAEIPAGSAVLVECLGTILANEIYSPAGAGEKAVSSILEGVDALLTRCGDLVLVSNEVCSAGTEYEGDTLHYLEALGGLHCALTARADRVAEVVCGLPLWQKGDAL